MIIVTHRSPDMDALVSVYIVLREAGATLNDVAFRSSQDDFISGAIYLDLTPLKARTYGLPGVMDHHYGKENPYVTAEQVWAFYGRKPEYRILVEEAGMQDRCQDREKRGIRFRDVFIAVKGRMIDVEKSYSDVAFAARMFDLFDAVIEKERRVINAHEEVENLGVQYRTVGNYTIAYYTGRATPFVGQYLFGKVGVSFIAYCDNNNLGISRNAEIEKPSLMEIKPMIDAVVQEQADEWFYHAQGFLACRGSFKSPAKSPPNIQIETLVGILANFLEETAAAE